MPKANLYGPWEAHLHGNKNATRYYIMNAKHDIIAVHMQPGIARAIALLPDLIEENGRLRRLLQEAYLYLPLAVSLSEELAQMFPHLARPQDRVAVSDEESEHVG